MYNLLTRRAAVLFSLALCAASSAFAQSSASTLKIIVPSAAGSGSDVAARMLSEELAKSLNRPVVIDNRPGAFGTLGTAIAAKAPPDGTTLVMIGGTAITQAQYLVDRLPYDPQKDLMPIYLFAASPLVWWVGSGTNAKTAAEFIAQIKADPSKYSFAAHTGPTLAAMESFKKSMGLSLLYVQYKTPTQALIDISSGQTTTMFNDLSGSAAIAADNKIRPLAVMYDTRLTDLPNTPTVFELGYKGPVLMPWTGFFAPAGTPPALIAQYNTEIGKIAARPEFQARMKQMGLLTTTNSTPESFAAFISAEATAIAPIMKNTKENSAK